MTIATTNYKLLSLSLVMGMTVALTACPSDDTAETDTDPTTSTTGDGDGDPTGPFVFDESPPGDYSQIDRMGMPAINTAVITSKDAYNADNPASDINGDYVNEIVANLGVLHAALDDDLEGLDLTPCDIDTCVAQAAPLVVPDTLTLTLDGMAGFPNGRKLEDPVMDVTLAVVLLDLDVHAVDALVGVNPTENDVAFLDTFPYLAAPN